MHPDVSAPLAALAGAMGVQLRYEDYRRRPVDVAPQAVRRALRAMGVDAADDTAAQSSLDAILAQRSRRTLPETIVVRPGGRAPTFRVGGVAATVTLEGGEQHTIDVRGGALHLPQDLPLGYHRLDLDTGTHGGESTHLIVTPGRCPLPLDAPGYGWMVQLYAARSRDSWGIGDCADLATIARWGGEGGAAMVLLNPLHAATPVLPQQTSPYSPTSRRYRNLLYLRIEDVPGFDALDPAAREEIADLAQRARDAGGEDRIERDAAFTAKLRALEALFDRWSPADAVRDDYRRWRTEQGQGLQDFATFCALAERHGAPWQQWPDALRRPDAEAVTRARHELRDRVELHTWIQWLLVEQLATAQRAATDSGMAVGIIHDLAVGVDPGGADAWALQDDLATGMTVGAPPDGFNQRGQDWALPPFLPHRLAASGYAPFRDMIRSVLTHAGGLRIDHVMGLWRLWWVPQDGSAAEGTYVRYPAEDLLGVLSLEAHRAGALIVGEDLGTVEEGVRETLAEHRILSSRVVYFEHVDDDFDQPLRPAADYPRLALTSITTHDLPTPAGWWTDEDVRVQTELGLFGDATTPAEQAQRKAAERAAMLDLLRSEGLVGEDPDTDERVVALHRFLARTPSLLVATGLGDALGDRRQPNLPGTVDEYPNWRLPLARWSPDGPATVWLEDLVTAETVRTVATVLAERTSQ